MRRHLPADDHVTTVMEGVLAQAAENGRRATVTAVEKALGIPHATFDRNYRHLIEGFRQRAQQQATAARTAELVSTPARSCSGSAEKARTCRVDTPAHLGPSRTRAKLDAAAIVTTLPSGLTRRGG